MIVKINPGDCVEIPDGRVGRIRAKTQYNMSTVRVRRNTSNSHQFLEMKDVELRKIDCPKGWMSPDGFNRYIKTTLKKMKERLRNKK